MTISLEPVAGAPRTGPCTAWCSLDDFEGTTWRDKIPDEEAQNARLSEQIDVASDLLFHWSARKFAGLCEETVEIRDTQNSCVIQAVRLADIPVRRVTQVQVDDDGDGTLAVLDPSLYRLDDYKRLIRLDNVDGTNPGWPIPWTYDQVHARLLVTMDYGRPPPPSGVSAAVELAGELTLARLKPSDCRLPQKVTNYVRQGVTVQVAEAGDFKSLAAVKAFLSAHNPTDVRRRSGVMNPDLDSHEIRRGTAAPLAP